MEAFRDKGRLSSVVARMPVRVILTDDVALYGAAAVAARTSDRIRREDRDGTQHRSRNSVARTALHRHHPHPVHGRGAAGGLRASGHPDGAGAARLPALHPAPSPQPRQPPWMDRDRFVLSAGHASMLLYSVLYLSGYDLSLDDLKQFRQWDSRTPGHPEHGVTPGVETTTGPLGQGVGNAVGFAVAEAHLAAVFNGGGHRPVDHHTFFIASDGDMMEGVSHEAASLAGHLRLGKLIGFYDDNHITIEGDTALAFSEDVGRPLRGVRLARAARGGRERPRRARPRHPRGQGGHRPAVARRGPHPHRVRQPQQGRHRRARTARRSARTRSGSPSRRSAGPRPSPSSSPTTRSPNGGSAATAARRSRRNGSGATTRSRPPSRIARRSSSGATGASCRPDGTPTSRAFPPGSRSRPGTRRRRCSTRSHRGCPS